MIRIPINLASEPFRRDRPVLVASVAGSIALVVSLVVLMLMAVNERHMNADTRDTLDRLNTQLADLNRQQSTVEATLRRPENAAVLERSLLLNTLLLRKGISWTRIFEDLEKVTPHNVRLILVRLPQIDAQNQVLLDMQVGAQSPQPVIEFLKKLESSPLFGPVTESSALPPSQNDPLYRYRVSVSYAQKL